MPRVPYIELLSEGRVTVVMYFKFAFSFVVGCMSIKIMGTSNASKLVSRISLYNFVAMRESTE